jgi:hypothetical protein
MLESLKGLNITKSAPKKDHNEEITFLKFKYGVKDLDSVSIDDTLLAAKKLLSL